MAEPLQTKAEDLLQALQQPETAADFDNQKKALQDGVAYLIHHNFERLLRLLYTVDVDERDLKHLLQEHPQHDAAAVITALLVQRQLQKMKTRQQYKNGTAPTNDEAW